MTGQGWGDTVRGGQSALGGDTVRGGQSARRGSTMPSYEPAEPSGFARLGRYAVLGEVGSGGTGRVLRAYDPKLQREVALKELHPEALEEDGAQSLVAEARAMAKLSHPNVVSIYDVEVVPDRSVVLAMEYVPGPTLKTWLRGARRPWPEVMERLVGAGRGLAAAHDVGLLHRDFKPANVLLAPDGTVKVTDFGLAKRAQDAISVTSSGSGSGSGSMPPIRGGMTATGLVQGTPAYMAPEQHLGEPLSPAADQYCFCVTLWEALTGVAPYKGQWEQLAAQKVGGPPPWPERTTVPRPIVEAIRRGLAPEPARRWPSMHALLDVLVAASAPRRRRIWWWAAGAVGLLSAGGLSAYAGLNREESRCTGASQRLEGVWDEARRAEVEAVVTGIDASYAQDAWARTSVQLDAYAEDWVEMHHASCEATTLRGEQSAAVMDLRMVCLDHARVSLAAVTQVLADADEDVVRRTHELTAGLFPLSRCADVEALVAGVEPPPAEERDRVAQVRARVAEAKAERRAGRYADARTAVGEARAQLESIEYEPVRTEVALVEGEVLDELGEYDAAEAALLEALEVAARHRQWEAMARSSMRLMYVVGYRLNRQEEGLRYRELARGLAHGEPTLEAWLHNDLATVLQAQGRYAEAEAEHRRALGLREQLLGAEHPDVAKSRNNVAVTLSKQGRYAEAEAEHRRALELRQRVLGSDHPDVAMSLNNLASVLNAQGRGQEAGESYERSVQTYETALGADHPNLVTARENLAVVYMEEGELEKAEEVFRQTLAQREKTLGPEHPDVGTSLGNLGTVLLRRQQREEAEQVFRRALDIKQARLGIEHPEVAHIQHNLAMALLERSVAEHDRSLAVQALPFAELSWERRKEDDLPARVRADGAFTLARLLWMARNDEASHQRARELAQRAIEGYRAHGGTVAQRVPEVQQWLEHGGLPSASPEPGQAEAESAEAPPGP